MGRAPGCAERFARAKASRRCSGSSFSKVIAELETAYSPHLGQAMLTPSIATSIRSALAPQTRQFMCWLRRFATCRRSGGPNPLLVEKPRTGGRHAQMHEAEQQERRHAIAQDGGRDREYSPSLAAARAKY